MFSKILEKTNPGFRNTLAKLQTYLKPAEAETEGRNELKANREKPYLLAVNNTVKQEITRHIGNAETPDFIRKFLHAQWSRLMLKIYLKKGPKSDAWKHSVQVIDDLVNFTGDKHVKQINDHQKDMQFLMRRLSKGMSLIPLPPTERNQFFRKLLEYDKTLLRQFGSHERSAPEIKTMKAMPIAPTGNRPSVLFGEELLVDNKKELKSDLP